jgi:hypothetical protein
MEKKSGDTFTGQTNITKSESADHTMAEIMAPDIITGQGAEYH